MKITVSPGLNPIDVIRRAGYGQVRDQRATEISYSRRMGSGIYPRFHVYINGDIINMHLDQKQASYEGVSAHSGEYDGATVEAEGARIIGIMDKLQAERFSGPVPQEEQEKKGGFWGLFGK